MTGAGTVLLKLLGLAFALLHIVQLAAFVLPSGQIRGLHVSGAVVIAALAIVVDAERRVWQRALAAAGGFVALVPLVYLQLEHHALVSSRSVFANDTDVAIGVTLVATLLLVTALEWRMIIPSLAVLGLAYGYWGWWFDNELLNHGGLSFRRLVAYASIPSFRGALGDFAQISAYNLFMFMVFAGVLDATGGMDFIMRLSAAIGGRSRSGPAQVAVVSSGLQGMVSGSSVANVASSGVLTIPLMIKYGYARPFAAAVEAVASNGGQITPPVMGVAAFLMVGLTGIPYGEIATAAILPAVVYFLHCAVGVQIATLKQGIRGLSAAEVEALRGPSLARDLLANAHLGFAVLFLVAALTYGLPEGNAAMIATLTLLGLDVVKRLVFGQGSLADRLRVCGRVVRDGLGNGAVQGAKIAIVVVTIGIFVEILVATGFAQKLSIMMLGWAGGSLAALVLMAGLACLVFGCGMPTSAAYLLVALLGAPALVQGGVPMLAAHMFLFFMANISSLTPPVAVASLVASSIAKTSFWRTCWEGLRLALPGFVLPFLFVAHPATLGLGTSWLGQLVACASALLACIALNVALEGHLARPISVVERGLLTLAALGMLHPEPWSTAIGVIVVAILFAFHLAAGSTRRRSKESP